MPGQRESVSEGDGIVISRRLALTVTGCALVSFAIGAAAQAPLSVPASAMVQKSSGLLLTKATRVRAGPPAFWPHAVTVSAAKAQAKTEPATAKCVPL